MVSRGRGRVMFALSLLLATMPAAGAQLQLVVHRIQVQLGQPIRVLLQAVDLPADLRRVDLSPLRRDFGVVADDVQHNSTASSKIESRILHLFPRRVGDLTIPALQLAGQRTHSVHVQVTRAVLDTGPVQIHTSVSTHTPWQRQQVVVEMAVSSRDPFFGLATDPPQVPGFEVLPITPRRSQIRAGGTTHTVQHIGWALFPLQAGNHVLNLPPVRYVENGLPRRAFYPPQVHLRIRALPPYLPPVIPVGMVTIRSAISPGAPVRTGRLSFWQLDVRGSGIPAGHLPPVLRAVKSSKDLHFFPAQIHRSNRLDDTGVHGEARYRIPFRTTASGVAALPTLRLMYFDPTSGRLATRRYVPPRPLSVSLAWWIILWMLLGAALVVGGRVVRRWLIRRQRRQRLRNQAWKEIGATANPRALRAALATVADAEGWSTNHTIGGWLKEWQRHYVVVPELSDALLRLEEQCYGPQPGHIPTDLRDTLLQNIRRPVLTKKTQ